MALPWASACSRYPAQRPANGKEASDVVVLSDMERTPARSRCYGSGDRFHGEGDRLAAADAEAGDPATAADLLEPVEQGDQHPRPAGADRVPQGDGAAEDVDLPGGDLELALGGHSHRGERLVDLEQVGAGDRPAHLLEELLQGADRGDREPLGLAAERRVADDPRP